MNIYNKTKKLNQLIFDGINRNHENKFDALLLIDVQDTCVLKQYEFKDWGLTTNKCRATVPIIKKLVNNCRKNNIDVIHILTKEWIERELPDNINRLYNETPNAKFYREGVSKSLIKVQSGEKVFRKNNYSALGGTNGEVYKYMSQKFSTSPSIIIAGFYSTGCVNATIIEGFQNGIYWTIPIDCVQTFDRKDKQNYQDMLITDWKVMVGNVVKSYQDII